MRSRGRPLFLIKRPRDFLAARWQAERLMEVGMWGRFLPRQGPGNGVLLDPGA